MASICLAHAMNVKPRLPVSSISTSLSGEIAPALKPPVLSFRKDGSRSMRRQGMRLTCAFGKGKSRDSETENSNGDQAKFLMQRAVVLPLLASIAVGNASPAVAAGEMIDWAALLNPAETIAMPEEPKPAEPPSYKDLLGRLKKDSEETQEAAAPETSAETPATPAPLSLWERQQRRAQELREKTMKAQAEREAAARALQEKREAERAEQMAREEAERQERARVAAEKEAAARAEREATMARMKASESKPAQTPAVKVDKPAPPVKQAAQPTTASGKKKTHGFLPLFLAQFLLFAAYAGGIAVIFFVPDKELEKVRKPLAEVVDQLLELATKAMPMVETAISKGQELAVAAAPVAAKAIEAAKPVAAQAVEASKPLIKQAQEKAKTLVEQAKENSQKTG